MKERIVIPQEDTEKLYANLKKDAESRGYHLNPDTEFAKSLAESLLVNEKRYGYRNCPCRLSSLDRLKDLDIICPCDYRDADLDEYDACFCALYVSEKIIKGKASTHSIPERRLPEGERSKNNIAGKSFGSLTKPVWRCRVCGYLCGRDEPPHTCPICKAEKDRFERFI